jgi:SnoaL-like domain
MIADQMEDRHHIRTLIESWVVCRDAGLWEPLARLWHDDGRIVTTWCECAAPEFIAMCKAAWARGATDVTHSLGGAHIEIRGLRAVAQTKMSLVQRAALDGVAVDVTCYGRFFDLLECRKGRWGLVLRHPIYDMDRIDAVDFGEVPVLDSARLREFPEGYRHLGYVQAAGGMMVNRGLPGRTGAAVQSLYGRGQQWLTEAPRSNRVT